MGNMNSILWGRTVTDNDTNCTAQEKIQSIQSWTGNETSSTKLISSLQDRINPLLCSHFSIPCANKMDLITYSYTAKSVGRLSSRFPLLKNCTAVTYYNMILFHIRNWLRVVQPAEFITFEWLHEVQINLIFVSTDDKNSAAEEQNNICKGESMLLAFCNNKCHNEPILELLSSHFAWTKLARGENLLSVHLFMPSCGQEKKTNSPRTASVNAPSWSRRYLKLQHSNPKPIHRTS